MAVFNRCFCSYLCFVLLSGQAVVGVASAVSVPPEERNLAAQMKAEVAQIDEEKRAEAELVAAEGLVIKAAAETAEAKAIEAKAEAELLQAQVKAAQAQSKEAAAQAAAQQANSAVTKAEMAATAARKAAVKAQTAALSAQRAAEQAAVMAGEVAEREAAAAEVAVIDETRIDELADKADAAAERIGAAAANADAKAAIADRLAAKADTQAELAARLADEQALAVDASTQAAEALAEAKIWLEEAWAELAQAQVSAADRRVAAVDMYKAEQEAKAYVAELKKPVSMLNPVYFETQANFYRWQNGADKKGYQFVQPYSFYYADKTLEYGLNTAYIISQNNSNGNKGRLAAWSDSELALAHTHSQAGDAIRYSLDINVPTGKTALSDNQKNAAMDEDLVDRNGFGEGWNFTPGISLIHKIGREDTWTLGMKYGFRGKYNLYKTDTSPGNSWSKNVVWTHAGQQSQFTGELRHTSYTSTRQIGADYYRQGDELDANFVYNRELAQDQGLMLYYRYLNQQGMTAFTSDFSSGGTSIGHYTGFVWSRKYGAKHTLRLTGDVMHRSGSIYDPETELTINARTKYTAGIGLDVALSPDRRVSADVQKFRMDNELVNSYGQKNRYDGYTILMRYNGSF